MNDEQTEADSETIIDALRERIEQLEEELADALRRTTDKKSDIDSYKTIAGLWEVDHKETDGGDGRYYYYFIMNEDGKVVCDTLNSDVQEIHMDDDENGSYSWDEQGKKDLTRLVECRNALAGVPDPAKLIEAVDNVLKMSKGQALPHHVWAVIDALRAARGPKGVGK